jgi:hypothetical protein
MHSDNFGLSTKNDIPSSIKTCSQEIPLISDIIISQKNIDDVQQDIEIRFQKNFFNDNQQKEGKAFLCEDFSNTILTSTVDKNPKLTLDELNSEESLNSNSLDNTKDSIFSSQEIFISNELLVKEKRCKKKFNVIYPEISPIITNIINKTLKEKNILLKRKRLEKRRRRLDNQDNIRKKIKRGFLNNALYNKLNKKLKEIGSKLFLEKFPQKFACDVVKKTNKLLLNMNLEEIFEMKELYNEKELKNYYHNLKVVKNKEIQENEEFKKILNKKYHELFEEYINSDEFIIDEINRLKKNKMHNTYIEKYIYLAENFIEFFSN